jgi:hypothetical protein
VRIRENSGEPGAEAWFLDDRLAHFLLLCLFLIHGFVDYT